MSSDISPRTRFRVLNRDGFRCTYCGRTPEHGITLHIDHVYPQSLGGNNDETNLVTACSECNLGKSATLLEERQAAPVISLVGMYTCHEWFADEAEARQYGCDHAGECGASATYAIYIDGYGGSCVCDKHVRFYSPHITYRLDSIPIPPAA